MIEAAIRDRRSVIDSLTGRDRRDKNLGAAEMQIDARLALLHAAQHLGAEHFLEPLRHRLGIGGAQMNMIPRECGHGAFSLFLAFLKAGASWHGALRAPTGGGMAGRWFDRSRGLWFKVPSSDNFPAKAMGMRKLLLAL